MKRFKSIVLAALAVFLVAAYIPTPSASAQSSSASLSIAPRKNYVMDPGQTITDKISVRNVDNSRDLDLNLRVIDFTYTDDTGTPKLLLDNDNEPTTWSLRPYMTTKKSVTVPSNKTGDVDISITLPRNLGAGSYYSAIIYSTGAPDGGNVGLSASGVTLVFVTVPGSVNEDLTLKKFGAFDQKKNDYAFISMDEPQAVAFTLENKGNVAEAPVGSIKLRDMFGHEYSIDEMNPTKSLALIGQTRTFQSCIKSVAQTATSEKDENRTKTTTCTSAGLWPGLYTASIDAFYGQNGNNTREITKTAHFWYLPLWFIIIAVLILLAIAFYVWRTIVWMKGGSFKLGGTPRGAGRRPSRRRR